MKNAFRTSRICFDLIVWTVAAWLRGDIDRATYDCRMGAIEAIVSLSNGGK